MNESLQYYLLLDGSVLSDKKYFGIIAVTDEIAPPIKTHRCREFLENNKSEIIQKWKSKHMRAI